MGTANVHSTAESPLDPNSAAAWSKEELPLTVGQAATYLGVSSQKVYLWVERKQIRHFRVMGRNIRFLKSDLEPFRAQFKQAVVMAVRLFITGLLKTSTYGSVAFHL